MVHSHCGILHCNEKEWMAMLLGKQSKLQNRNRITLLLILKKIMYVWRKVWKDTLLIFKLLRSFF